MTTVAPRAAALASTPSEPNRFDEVPCTGEAGHICSLCVYPVCGRAPVCTPRHTLTGLATPTQSRLRSLWQTPVERSDSLPEQRRRRAFPRLPLVDDGFVRRAHQGSQLRLAQFARATSARICPS